MANFCKNCGSEIRGKFCGVCGNELPMEETNAMDSTDILLDE